MRTGLSVSALILLSGLSLASNDYERVPEGIKNVISVVKTKATNFTSLLTDPFNSVYIFYRDQMIEEFKNPQGTGIVDFQLASNLTQSTYYYKTKNKKSFFLTRTQTQNSSYTFDKEIDDAQLLERVSVYDDLESSTTFGFMRSQSILYLLTLSENLKENYFLSLGQGVQKFDSLSFGVYVGQQRVRMAFSLHYNNKMDVGAYCFLMDPVSPQGRQVGVVLDEKLTGLKSEFEDMSEINVRLVDGSGSDGVELDVLIAGNDNQKIVNLKCKADYNEQMMLNVSCGDPGVYSLGPGYGNLKCDSTQDYILCSGFQDKLTRNRVEVFLKIDGVYNGDGEPITNLRTVEFQNGDQEFFQVENFKENEIIYIDRVSKQAAITSVHTEIEKINASFWSTFFVMLVCTLVLLTTGIFFAVSAGHKFEIVEKTQSDAGENSDGRLLVSPSIHDNYGNKDIEGF